MRVTPFIIFNQLTQSLDKTMQDYATLNEQLTTSKRMQAPSDDAAGLKRAMDYKVQINNNGQYLQNIDVARNNLTTVNTVMTSYDKFLASAMSLVSQSKSGLADPTASVMHAQQAAALRDIFLNLGNTKTGDQYLFAGFQSNTQPYNAATYAYQGDSGVMKIQTDDNSTQAANVTGNNVFSYTLAAATSKLLSSGNIAHYTPGPAGTTTVTVDIRQADDVSRPATDKTFTFSNVMQMANELNKGITAAEPDTLEALIDPFTQVQAQSRAAQTDVATRLQWLEIQDTNLTNNTDSLQATLASVEDADMLAVVARLKTTEITLQSVRESASRVLSMSLFNFLK